MLGRQAVRAGLRAWRGVAAAEPSRTVTAGAGASRSYSSEKPTGEALPDEFKHAWKSVAPNLDLPRFPISYMTERPETPTAIPTSLTVNLVLPYKFEIKGKQVRSTLSSSWPDLSLIASSVLTWD
jgi:F-type H+-transporting ATPase subunit delta